MANSRLRCSSILNFEVIEVGYELIPLGGEHIVLKVPLLLIINGRVLDAVQRELLQVPDVQLPAERDVDHVECDARVVEEARVVRADGSLEALVHHVAHWMVAHVKRVAQHHV